METPDAVVAERTLGSVTFNFLASLINGNNLGSSVKTIFWSGVF